MSDMREVFFSIGEFARLCATTKDTLFYYESIGLLKPRRQANGYRQYTAEDFFIFNVIQVLRQTGSSLEEIREHLAHHDTEQTLDFSRRSGSSWQRNGVSWNRWNNFWHIILPSRSLRYRRCMISRT